MKRKTKKERRLDKTDESRLRKKKKEVRGERMMRLKVRLKLKVGVRHERVEEEKMKLEKGGRRLRLSGRVG